MIGKIQDFFASKKTQSIALLTGTISMLLAGLCLVAPLSREKWAITSLGETTTNQLSPITMSIEHYEPKRLKYLLATQSEGKTYEKLVELLSQAKKDYGFSRLVLIYENEGELFCLADADYSKDGEFSVGEKYLQEYFDEDCAKTAQKILEGKEQEIYIEKIYDGNLVLAYSPLKDKESGEMIAVLCAEAPLKYTNFSQFYGFELANIAEALLAVFITCFVTFFIGKSFSIEENYNSNKKNEKSYGHIFQKPVVTQQENNIYIDTLDDVDPNDYL